MNFYTVYKKSKDLPEECVLIKSGFCWKNFFFGIIWALYKRIWDLVLVQLIFISVALFLSFYSEDIVQIIVIALALHLLLSFYVAVFFKWKLVGNGYKAVDVVAASTEEEAFLRFLSCSKKS